MSSSIVTYKLTHTPRRYLITCARCGCETTPQYGAGNAHVGSLFCADMECYAVSLLLRYVVLCERETWCEQVAQTILALPVQEVCVRLLEYRERCTILYGKVWNEEWTWIIEKAREQAESEVAA